MESIMSSKLFTTRRGTIILGVSAAVLAAIALLVYLNQYRNSVNSGTQPLQVLVAKSLIQKGTPGDVIASTNVYQINSIPRSQVKSGAFVDPKTLDGQVATADINPGQQLTSADFATGTGSTLLQKLSRDQRAVVLPLDVPGALGGQLAAGDRVDVYISFNQQAANGVSKPIVRDVLQNMLVLTVPTSGSNITLRANPTQAGELIFASQNAKIWLVLRPTVGSTLAKTPLIGATDLLTGGAQVSKP